MSVNGSSLPNNSALVRIIHHSRGASLTLRYHSAFASLTNTGGIRSVAENTVITNTVAIHSLSGELSRLGLRVVREDRIRTVPPARLAGTYRPTRNDFPDGRGDSGSSTTEVPATH